MSEQDKIKLTESEAKRFAKAIENPPEPNKRLTKAANKIDSHLNQAREES